MYMIIYNRISLVKSHMHADQTLYSATDDLTPTLGLTFVGIMAGWYYRE